MINNNSDLSVLSSNMKQKKFRNEDSNKLFVRKLHDPTPTKQLVTFIINILGYN